MTLEAPQGVDGDADGLIRATAGRAEIFGVDCQADPIAAHGRVAFVPGDVSLWPTLSGTETLHLLGRVHGHVDVAYRDALLERFEFDPGVAGVSGFEVEGNRPRPPSPAWRRSAGATSRGRSFFEAHPRPFGSRRLA